MRVGSGISPCSVETASEKRSPRTSYPPGWEAEFAGHLKGYFKKEQKRLFNVTVGKPPQYSCLENPMDGGAWWAAVHGVATSQTQLSDFTFTFYFHTMEKAMATHSSVLAWGIPGTAEPGRLWGCTESDTTEAT